MLINSITNTITTKINQILFIVKYYKDLPKHKFLSKTKNTLLELKGAFKCKI